MGEMLIIHNGVEMDRQTGNGILNKLLHGTAPQHEADCVALRIWDSIPVDDFNAGECAIDYEDRLNFCYQLADALQDKETMDVVYTEELENKEQSTDFYSRMRANGKEGSVLKLGTAKWKDHTSPDQIKKKNVSTCALRLKGWKYGKDGSKYEDVAGALHFESECGKVKVTVNCREDEMRSWDFDKLYDSIWTIAFERVSYSKNKTEASLYLPRIEKIRDDRTTADSVKEIVARCKEQ
jgi:hypothetical protein